MTTANPQPAVTWDDLKREMDAARVKDTSRYSYLKSAQTAFMMKHGLAVRVIRADVQKRHAFNSNEMVDTAIFDLLFVHPDTGEIYDPFPGEDGSTVDYYKYTRNSSKMLEFAYTVMSFADRAGGELPTMPLSRLGVSDDPYWAEKSWYPPIVFLPYESGNVAA